MEACLCIELEISVFPQHVCAGERRVAAEIHFDRGREPTEIVALALRNEERSLREIHLARDVEHPLWIRWLWQDADRGWVPSERAIGEGVNLRYPKAHAFKSIAPGLVSMLPSSPMHRQMRSHTPPGP